MYRYYLTQRPFSPGTFPGRPSDWADISDRGRVFVPEINRKAWAWVEYKSPLAQKEVDNYELVPAFPVYEVGELDERFREGFEQMNRGYACTGETLNVTYPTGESVEYVVFIHKICFTDRSCPIPTVVDCDEFYRVAGYSKFYRVDKKTLLATEEE